ncbi:alpha/beta-hydrolase [Basidiobolus meristosporus CBS 931.73]|uniref:Alpha/beta-hydrolase n=1 Tax=Basidiobolus meristosporus CBS 931.73 TaxID=1314790 RepID=A0A1Y1Y0X5_9FUNG|nr:alpha/beta-hydrolase [Basidiobolus meristosporus CBS 931.73]|eukprot:ORX91650.1 alpha/beta-hydrolase [Basidiobolus meristosporus CBS 931.73]
MIEADALLPVASEEVRQNSFIHCAASSVSSLYSWYWPTAKRSAEEAEYRLLSRLKFFSTDSNDLKDSPDVGYKTIAKSGLVDIGDGQKINTFVIDSVRVQDKPAQTAENNPSDVSEDKAKELGYHASPQTDLKFDTNVDLESESKDKQPKKVLVITHGYGAGLGCYYRNLNSLSQVPGWRIYAIDWLGMGRSSRSAFPHGKRYSRTEEERVSNAENFFVDSLERWREKNGIEEMTLLGHSMGGYLSAVYAMKYPNRVNKLILASPVGIPKNQYKEPEENKNISLQNSQPNEFSNRRRVLPGWAVKLWNWNVTPQSIVRFTGRFGPSLVGGYVYRRFAFLDKEDQDDLKDYIYHISSMSGSGEYALGTILEPGAFARKPLIDRLHELKVPTTFLYGAVDWMDHRHALEARKRMKVPTKVVVIPRAGHQLFIENPVDFDNAVIAEMTDKQQEHEVEADAASL